MVLRLLKVLAVLLFISGLLMSCTDAPVATKPFPYCTATVPSYEHLSKLVVMGSSSAAGAGAEGYAYSWAGQLEAYLEGEMSVANIAVGGAVSFELLPENCGGFIPNNWFQFKVNSNANVDLALSFQPSVVVISLPSNDQAVGIESQFTVSNFKSIQSTLSSAGVQVFLVGLQPRTPELAERLIFDEKILAKEFGGCWVSVWDQLADRDGALSDNYNYDGVHLNRLGHQVVFERLIANIQSGSCS